MLLPYYKKENFELYQGDSLEILRDLSSSFDMIFADPPYFLSTGNGININGQFIKFDKGQWDRVRSKNEIDAFNKKWLSSCCNLLKDNGTIWICGTYHNIFSIEKCLEVLDFKIINFVVWQNQTRQKHYQINVSISAQSILYGRLESGAMIIRLIKKNLHG